MSIVLGYADKEQAIIMSDGRAGKNGAYNENYNKTTKINQNVIMGGVGYAEEREAVEKSLTEIFSNTDACIRDIIEWFIWFLDDNVKSEIRSTFMIIGKDKDQHFHTCMIGHAIDCRLSENIANTPRCLIMGGTISKNEIDNVLFTNIRNRKKPLIENMKKCIYEIAEMDVSVNRTLFTQSLKMGDIR